MNFIHLSYKQLNKYKGYIFNLKIKNKKIIIFLNIFIMTKNVNSNFDCLYYIENK